MDDKIKAADGEFEAIKVIHAALEPLSGDARARVIEYIIKRLDIVAEGIAADRPSEQASYQEAALVRQQSQAPKYTTLADLFDAASPQTNADRALVAGYWLQVCEQQDDFDGQSANRELKNLGEQISNITIAMNSLRRQKPALVIQLSKSGKSQQARKRYKVTVAGISAVEAMING